MNSIRVGLIGYGYAGATFHAPLIRRAPALQLSKIATSRPDKVEAALPGVAVAATPDALLADAAIDLVVITAPNDSHARLARQALEAGKHVVVEKPFVTRSADGDALIQLAVEKGRVLSVFHNRRWDGDFLTVKQLIASGTLGEVATFESHFDRYRPAVRNRWREDDVEGAGLLYDLGSHLIDQAIQLFGLPKTVQADLCLQRAGAKAVDYFHLVLGYGRLRVILHAGCLVRGLVPRFQVHGSQGSFIKHGLDTQEAALLRGDMPGSAGWGQDLKEYHGRLSYGIGALSVDATVETLPGCYQAYYEALAASVTGTGPDPVPAKEALSAIRVIEADLRSHSEQRVIAFS